MKEEDEIQIRRILQTHSVKDFDYIPESMKEQMESITFGNMFIPAHNMESLIADLWSWKNTKDF